MKNVILKLTLLSSLLLTSMAVSQVPTITSFTPTSGPIGTSVTITGTNFNSTAANNVVYFGAVKANVTNASPTELTVTVPTGSTYAPITVTDTTTGLTAYSSVPFVVTFVSPQMIDANSFASKVDFSTGTNPYNVIISDLDGDGKIDLITPSATGNTISVHRNTSTSGTITTGSFASKVDFTAGTNPYHVEAGDLDEDGKPDLVVVNVISNTVSVYRNTSTVGTIDASSFADKVDFTTEITPVCVAIGDIDGDGKPDLVVANASFNTVSVFRNTSTSGLIDFGSFASRVGFATGTSPNYVVIGDIDGDGKGDLVVTNQGSNTLSVLRNICTPGSITGSSFATKVDFTIGASSVSVAIGDIDGDGKPDLAATYGNSVSVFRNTSTSGTIDINSLAARVDFTTGIGAHGVAIGDVDGDGKPDLAVTNNSDNTVSVLRNTSTPGSITLGSFAGRVDFSTGTNPEGVVIGDIDGDGKADLVVANLYVSSSSVSVLRNTITPDSRTLDSLALVDLYDSTGGANWTNKTNWKSANPIDTWYGVTVSGGRVTKVLLSVNNLTGNLPQSFYNLSALTELDFSVNHLSMDAMSPSFLNMPNLSRIALNGCGVTSIPDLSALPLTGLSLNGNLVTGTIPSWIWNETGLDLLDLGLNRFSQQSLPAAVGNLTSLGILDLTQDSLTGSIPSQLSNLTGIGQLKLGSNLLNNGLNAVTGFSSCFALYLDHNRFTGLPNLSSLSALQYLLIQNNQFSFEDIEPNIGVPSTTFTYSPQDSVGIYKDTTVVIGSAASISVNVGGANNQYQWYKNGNPVGTNSATYSIPSATAADSGIYYCRITNTIATDLTLYSRTFKLQTLPNKSLHVSATGNNANDGSAQFPLADIGDAMNKAFAGDTIKIGAGTWTENRTMAKQLVVLGGYAPGFVESQRNIFTNQTVWKAVGSPQITDNQSCIIDGFVFDGSSGSPKAINVTGGTTTITHCTIVNYTGSGNQGIAVNSGAGAVIKNNTIYNNQLSGGGVIFYSIAVNGSANIGTTKIENNIIVKNDVGIENNLSSSIANYNCVYNNTFLGYDGAFNSAGANDINADPKFIYPAGGDFRLKAGSPCIDAGNPVDPVGVEPSPNGGLINIGNFGGTINAARTGINPATYVSTSGNDNNDGTMNSPYKTITKALQSAPGDTIKVAAGNYAEGIITTGYGVLRGGYAVDFLESTRIPAINQTVIEAVGSTMYYDAFGAKLDGFVFDGKTNVAGTGLHLLGPAAISHTVIKNVKNGFGYAAQIEANVSFINNTIYNNTYGVYLTSGASSVVKNNIIRGNGFGLNNSAAAGIGSYNDFFNNSFNYTGSFTAPGTGDLALDPLNINAAAGNFQLASNSPCINAGDPAAQYNDPDGSRNDIGAYRFQNFPPDAPQNLTAAAGDAQVTLRWKKNSESDFLRYRIYRGTLSNPTIQTDSTTGGINDTLKVISGLINDTTYYFRITAVDSAGNQSEHSNEVNAVPLFDPPPSAPQNLSAVAGNAQVTLRWRKNTETDFLRYRVYQSTSPNASLQADSSLSDVSDTTKILGGLTNGITYYFRVTAIDTAKHISSYSNEGSATPFVLPSAPSSLTASAVSSTRIDLNWNAGTNATKYRIFRSLTSGTGFSQIDSVNSPAVAYSNTALTELTAYFYYVVGVNVFGTSANSNEASATTLAVPVSVGVPDISNTNPAPATNITISTQVTGTSPVVKLFFGKPHQIQGDSLTMAFGGGTYSATIPFSAVTQEGLWFRIRAQNSGGVTYYPVSGTQAISVQISDIATMISWSAFPEGLEADAYSTIAWSLNGTLNLPFYLGEQEFKDGGPSNWRALSFDAAAQTFSDVTDISSGNAYYFYHHGGGKEDLFSRGVNPSAISTNVFNEWVLKPGWNLVPWPYSFGAAISNRDQSKIGRVWLRNGKNGWEESTELKPFTGYMIYNKTAGDLVLGSVLSWSLSAGKSQASEFVWSARFQAGAGEYKDAFNVIGTSVLSSDAWDDLDERDPISVGQGVNVYFQSSGKMLAYDIRDANIGHEWNMTVENSTKNDKTILQWDIANLPQQFNLILYDMTHNKKIAVMDASSGYEFRNDYPTNFKVFAGSADWVEQNVQQLEKDLPQTFSLHQNYPNPFNPTTRIAFDVAQSGNVKIKIYNVLGQEVAALVNRYFETGRYDVEWNGRDNLGRQLSSGLYIYRLEAGNVSRMKKMLLVK